MKAIIYDKKSKSDSLMLHEVDKPKPKENEVLVKISTVSLNAADYRSMKLGIIPKGKIFGADIAGRVEIIGINVKKFKIGDEVFGDISGCGFGGLAEYVAVSEDVLAFKPKDVSFEIAAAVPMAAITALQALRNKGNIQIRHKVLINGASGGVGSFAIQLAKLFGAEVTAVCSGKNVDLVRSFGADYVIDYTKEAFEKRNEHYDVILAVHGNRSLLSYKRILNKTGVFVLVGGALSQIFRTIFFGPIISIGSKKMRFLTAKPNVNDLEFIIKLVEQGKIKPFIDKLYPLHEAAEAVKYLSEGHARGKVVIIVNKNG